MKSIKNTDDLDWACLKILNGEMTLYDATVCFDCSADKSYRVLEDRMDLIRSGTVTPHPSEDSLVFPADLLPDPVSTRPYNETRKGSCRKQRKMSKTYTLEQQVSYIQEFEKSGLTMAQFAREKELSYPQFYGWVKKYEKDGLNALVDRRGIRKEEGELSREEILERKLARLEKQLEEEKKLTKVLKKNYMAFRRLKDSLK